MKTKILSASLFLLFALVNLESGIVINDITVPYSKICGSSSPDCRATGFGSHNPLYRVYDEDRPGAEGKQLNFNYFGLGRAADTKAFHSSAKVIDLLKNDVEIDTATIDYDLHKENVTGIIVDLDAVLKENNIAADISADISNDFKKQLESYLVIKSNIITYSLKIEVIDSIRDAHDGLQSKDRFKVAATRLKEKNMPLIRQVIVIEEICSFKQNKGINNLLKPILQLKLGNTNPKVNLVLDMTKLKKKTSHFSSSYEKKSIYSYGYWNDSWMYKS